MRKKHKEGITNLEIEDPGAANKVAEEGASTITDSNEFLRLSVKLN